MLAGYNQNITYKNILFHVQTEDLGLKNPCVVSTLFRSGTVLAQRKTSYEELVQNPDVQKLVAKTMEEQHKSLLKDLVRGTFDASIK